MEEEVEFDLSLDEDEQTLILTACTSTVPVPNGEEAIV
jgi:hypothetical protein